MNEIYQQFVELCKKRKLLCKVSEVRYLEFREEYKEKFAFWKTVTECIDWCYDNEKKMVNANRLRNWFKNTLKFAKAAELRNLTKKTDIPQVKVKREPLWTPPI